MNKHSTTSLLFIIIASLNILSCNRTNSVRTNRINTFDFLNHVLRDTTNLNFIHKKLIISDIVTISPPFFKGEEIDFVASKLEESDTTFLKSQFSNQFTTDSLRSYGFEILEMRRISEIAKSIPSDSIWGYIHHNIGPGYYSIRKPIFNKAYNKVYFVIGYVCGPYCGSGRAYILEKLNDKWVIKEEIGFWES